MMDLSSFDWGPIEGGMKNLLTKEFFLEETNIYERFNKVKQGDIVVDLGSSVGPFPYILQNRNVNKIYCVEPSQYEIEALQNNTKGLNCTIFPYALGYQDGEIVTEVYGSPNSFEKVASKKFSTFIKENNIETIDFLKTDCEGGEYEVFNVENICWLQQNMGYCAGEWHLDTPEFKQKFREFRDVFLRVFPNHEVLATNGVDIKWDLWNEHFIEYYTQVIIYIDNRK